MLNLRLSAAAIFATTLLSTVSAIQPGFPYGNQKVRGVNIGGWLVLEPWITPTLFDNTGDPRIIDEWTFCEFQDRTRAANALRQHWDTFITEADFAAIAAAGLNHVRIPIGYWAYNIAGGEPWINGQAAYLQRAVGWAANHGLKVIVDLHGAPGSQNGFDNSGQKVEPPRWHTNPTNVARTNNVLKTLASLFKDNANVVPIIAPLNEPAGFRGNDMLTVTRQYWFDSYGNIRFAHGTDRQTNNVVMIHDAFQSLDYWRGFMSWPEFDGVMMDVHHYQVFSDAENARTPQQQIQVACSQASRLSGFHLWLVVGEWSPARSDCAKYLNGRGVGSRYDGSFPGSPRVGDCSQLTGDASRYSAEYKTFLRQYWEAQTSSFEKADGWVQWTWKTEQAHEWSYQKGLEFGWIPRNPTERMYPNICG